MIKIIRFNEHKITIEYFQRYEKLVLESWESDQLVPCRVEADYIESHIKDALIEEFNTNYDFYLESYIASLAEAKYDRDKAGA
jgi:hypothetical protein